MGRSSSFMEDGVWHFREGGEWLVKNAITVEEAAASINACIEWDGEFPEVSCDINIYEDELPDTPYTAEDFKTHSIGWWRWVPAPRDSDDYPCYLHPAKPNARGAFQAALLY